MSLKLKVEEVKWKEEFLNDLMMKWEEYYHNLEAKIVSLIVFLEKLKMEVHLDKTVFEGTKKVDQILSSQRSPTNKTDPRYSDP